MKFNGENKDKIRSGSNRGRNRRNATGLTSSTEDYLLTVREICEETDGSAQQIEIAAYMGFTAQSVIRGLRMLTREGLVTIEQDCTGKFVYLTEKGRALAKKLCLRRRIVTAYLEFLGLSDADARKEAHLWEHGISDETAAAMEAARNARKHPPLPTTQKATDEIRRVF
jgi:Mn-dependent DtxR family transcriptional regulator